MQSSKSYITRLRLHKEVNFTDDFRKKHMTRDYGNYSKYEKNSIAEEVEKGQNDDGMDRFMKNSVEMMKRVNSMDSQHFREKENKTFENLLSDESYHDAMLPENAAAE